MKIEQIRIGERIHAFIFENQREVASTFLRFQEHYESPHFKGKIFSLGEFKNWYIKSSRGGKKTGKFTYYSDWGGFNIPSKILKPFREGKFNPLSKEEIELLKLCEYKTEPFYIIGIHKKAKHFESVLNHEISHGLFHTNKEYKREVIKILSKFKLNNVKIILRESLGYHEDVMDDEINAYIIDGDEEIRQGLPESLIHQIEKKFKEYYKNSR